MTAPITDPTTPTRARLTRPILGGAVALMVGMWIYVLYLAIGPGRQPPPDRLDDPAFATGAQSVCDAANDQVRELPTASQARTAAERSVVLTRANAIYAEMVEALRGLTPPGEDGDVVTAWLTDWRTYLTDREDFAARLLEDENARLLVTPKKGEQVTDFIDLFATDNRMTACGTPADA